MKKIIVMGEVLYDIFPNRKCMGGAPFNFAIHLHRFGVPVHFVSRIGDDPLGSEILGFMEKEGFPVEGIQVDRAHPTGEVRVHLKGNGGHEFEILSSRAWDYIEWTKDIEEVLEDGVSLVYFGTLAQRGPISKKSLHKLLEKLSGKAPRFLDLNLRVPFYDQKTIEQSLRYCTFLKSNDEEIFKIQEILNLQGSSNLKSVAEQIITRFNIETLCITKGQEGCELYKSNGESLRISGQAMQAPFKDSVGAGDAFSAKLAYGFLHRWQDDKMLNGAASFASRVCTIAGAIPEDLQFYQIND